MGAETTALPVPGPAADPAAAARRDGGQARASDHDDRDSIVPGDRVVLIVESDTRFAATLLDIAQEHGFKGVIASDGGAALALAQALRPDAITLALRLPDVDGWVVLERLKHGAQTRHIPVRRGVAGRSDTREPAPGRRGGSEQGVASEALQRLCSRCATSSSATPRRCCWPTAMRRAARTSRSPCVVLGCRITSASLGTRVLEALRRRALRLRAPRSGLSDMSAIELLRRIVESETVTEIAVRDLRD